MFKLFCDRNLSLKALFASCLQRTFGKGSRDPPEKSPVSETETESYAIVQPELGEENCCIEQEGGESDDQKHHVQDAEHISLGGNAATFASQNYGSISMEPNNNEQMTADTLHRSSRHSSTSVHTAAVHVTSACENHSLFNNVGDKHDDILITDGGPGRSADRADGGQADDSSSESDDEVLKHYNEVRRGSVRSDRSTQHKKEKSQSSSRASLVDTNLSDNDGKKVDGQRSPVKGKPTPTPPPLSPEASYQNSGFQEELSPSHSVSSDPGAAATKESDEHLFDISDLQAEPPLISKCGSLEVTFVYDASKATMKIAVHQAKEVPTKERGGTNHSQVRLLLLPSKKQKHKTRAKTGPNPTYDELFTFTKVKPDDLSNLGVRFRLYGVERMRRERMIGECVVGFGYLSLEEPCTHWIILEPRSNLSHGDSQLDVSSLSHSESGSSTQSLQHGGMPELLLALSYNGTTGRLAVEVVKGSNFKNLATSRPPDTYVKLTLMSPTGQEVSRSKTSVRRGQPNPLFKETFIFQVALFQLADVTLMVSVYNKRSMKKKEMIGWFSLGQKNSGEEEASHWLDMRENKGGQVCRWHLLLEA